MGSFLCFGLVLLSQYLIPAVCLLDKLPCQKDRRGRGL